MRSREWCGASAIFLAIPLLFTLPQARSQDHDNDSTAIKAAIDAFTEA